jgi:hypothetical protein
MKKLFLLGAAIGLSGLAMAQTTVKKVIIEDYTGTWCGWCPEGTVVLEGLEAANPTALIAVANHNGDALQTTEGAAVDAFLQVSSYPNGSIDRKQFAGEAKVSVSRGKWSQYFNQRKAETAKVSVSFANPVKTASGAYTADVKVKFTEAPVQGTPLTVQVYVLEDSIPATGSLAQGNYSSAVQGGADPLNPWFHNATLRDALGGNWGYTPGVIPATPATGATYTQAISFTPTASWVKKNIRLVAFVAYNGTTVDKKEILNSEEIHLSSFFPLGVEEVKNVGIIGTYPNPASISQVQKIEYSIKESANVTMKVFNAIGQLVAQPYSSYEVEGVHTIHWNPSNHSLTPGMYIVEVASEGSRQTMKVNLY